MGLGEDPEMAESFQTTTTHCFGKHAMFRDHENVNDPCGYEAVLEIKACAGVKLMTSVIRN